MGAHGWVAGIASHGSVSLSRGWLISVEAPRHPGHLSSKQLDAVVNVYLSLFAYIGPEKPQRGVANCVYTFYIYFFLPRNTS